MIAAKHVGKAHATSIFLFRERTAKAAERTPGTGRLDREMAPVKEKVYHGEEGKARKISGPYWAG